MKIVIELNDADLKRAIDDKVAAQIALITGEAIKAQVDSILALKFGRVTETVVNKALSDAATAAITRTIGKGYNDSVVREALAIAATALLKERK